MHCADLGYAGCGRMLSPVGSLVELGVRDAEVWKVEEDVVEMGWAGCGDKVSRPRPTSTSDFHIFRDFLSFRVSQTCCHICKGLS